MDTTETTTPRTRGGRASLADTHPDLAAEWHPAQNGDLTAAHVTQGSEKKVWWQCALGHPFQAIIVRRTAGQSCRECTTITYTHPALAAQWHPTLNGGLAPSHVTRGSDKKVWWLCADGHAWEATVSGRTAGKGCRECNALRGVRNSGALSTTHPELAAQLDAQLSGFTADQVSASSKKQATFRCDNGHTTVARINNRALNGNGCRECAGYVTRGSLIDECPELIERWDADKNGELTAAVSAGSNQYAWWKCEHGHPSWESRINNVTAGTGCPHCSPSHTSRIEQALAARCANVLDGMVNGGRIQLRWSEAQTRASIDIAGTYRDRQVAIEYDGENYHRVAQAFTLDKSKTLALLDAGYLVIRIREDDLAHLPIEHPDLLQLDYRYKNGTDEQLPGYLNATITAIEAWLNERVPPRPSEV